MVYFLQLGLSFSSWATHLLQNTYDDLFTAENVSRASYKMSIFVYVRRSALFIEFRRVGSMSSDLLSNVAS